MSRKRELISDDQVLSRGCSSGVGHRPRVCKALTQSPGQQKKRREKRKGGKKKTPNGGGFILVNIVCSQLSSNSSCLFPETSKASSAQ